MNKYFFFSLFLFLSLFAEVASASKPDLQMISLPSDRNLALAGKCDSTPSKLPSQLSEISFHAPKLVREFFRGRGEGGDLDSSVQIDKAKAIELKVGVGPGSIVKIFEVGEFTNGKYKGYLAELAVVYPAESDEDPWRSAEGHLRFAVNEKLNKVVALENMSSGISQYFSDSSETATATEEKPVEKSVEHKLTALTLGKILVKAKAMKGDLSVDQTLSFREFTRPNCVNAAGVALASRGSEFKPNHPAMKIFWNQPSSEEGKLTYLPEPLFGKVFGRGYHYSAVLPDGTIQNFGWDQPTKITLKSMKGEVLSRNCFMPGGKRENEVPITESRFTNDSEDKKIAEKMEPFGESESVGKVYRLKKADGELLQYQAYLQTFAGYVNSLSYSQRDEPAGVHEAYSKEELLAFNPILYVKSPFGDFFACRDDWFYVQRWAEPLVYLYSPEVTAFKVTPSPKILLELAQPRMSGRTWEVITRPDGKLDVPLTGEVVPYLFWEGSVDRGSPVTEGFVVSGGESLKFFSKKLSVLGLNRREVRDFLKFWSDYTSASPYYLVHFLSAADIERKAPLIVTPQPDSVIRVSIEISPIESRIDLPEQILPTPNKRFGKTLIEWGVVAK